MILLLGRKIVFRHLHPENNVPCAMRNYRLIIWGGGGRMSCNVGYVESRINESNSREYARHRQEHARG